MHTSYSDGHGSYDEMIDEAVGLGFDFVAVTDHGSIGKIGEDTLNKCPQEKRLLCIIGEEVYSRDGDILALGITEPIPDNLTMEETIDKIHAQYGLAIPTHPNVPGHVSYEVLMQVKNKIDAVECYNDKHKLELNFSWLANYSNTEKIPCVFNSDTHDTKNLSKAYNVISIDGNLSRQGIFNAIKSGNNSPRINNFIHYAYYRLGRIIPFICQSITKLAQKI